MLQAFVLASALAFATTAAAENETTAPPIDAGTTGSQMTEDGQAFWEDVFPLPGESYGMFPDPYGNPHGDIRTALGDDIPEGENQVADTPNDLEQQADISSVAEGPDLRDASGQLD